MLDLDKLNELAKLTVKRVMRDYPEEDKILLDIDEIIQEAVRQNAKELNEQKNFPELNDGNVGNCSCSWIRKTDNIIEIDTDKEYKVYICENCRRYYIKEHNKYVEVNYSQEYKCWYRLYDGNSRVVKIKK
jgi:hypothetical protein